jgi:hypothetical protein
MKYYVIEQGQISEYSGTFANIRIAVNEQRTHFF